MSDVTIVCDDQVLLTMSYHLHLFPEVYTNGTRPPQRGVFDKRVSLATPSYAFGWVISRLELYQTIRNTDMPPIKLWLTHMPEILGDRIWPRWEEKGYDKYNPTVPEVLRVGKDHVLLLLACNESLEEMERIMADKAYHDECRDCLGNSKTMMLEPAWFRIGLGDMPKGFIPAAAQEAKEEEGPPTCACGHRC